MTELVIILGLALLLLGPDQLPSLAKSLGKGMRELRKATDDIKSTFEQEMARVDIEEQPRIMAPVPPKAPPADPGEARAAARMAAAGEPAKPPEEAQATLRLVAPEGTVPRDGALVASAEPAAPAAPVPSEEPKA